MGDRIPYEQAAQTCAQWTHDQEQLFIQLMVDIVLAKGNKNRSSVLFAKDEWKNMCRTFYDKTGRKYDLKQLKNKLTHLRSRYKIFHNLMKNATGIGWDHLLGTFDATDQRWDEQIQVLLIHMPKVSILL